MSETKKEDSPYLTCSVCGLELESVPVELFELDMLGVDYELCGMNDYICKVCGFIETYYTK